MKPEKHLLSRDMLLWNPRDAYALQVLCLFGSPEKHHPSRRMHLWEPREGHAVEANASTGINSRFCLYELI